MSGRSQTVFQERLARKLAIVGEAEPFGSALARASEEPGVTELAFTNRRARHIYCELHTQSTTHEGLFVEPGEHHTMLRCGTSAPAAFIPGSGGWQSPDPAIAWLLDQTEQRLELLQNDWRWHRQTPPDGSYYDATWAVQLRPVARGTHLVMRGLQGQSPEGDARVGMELFLRVAWVIERALHDVPRGAPQHERHPTSFGAVAPAKLANDLGWDASRPPVDVGHALKAMLSPLANEKVTVFDLSPTRLELGREAVPEEAAALPIIGVIGGELADDAPKVVTLTPTHAFVRDQNLRASFSWSDVVDARAQGTDEQDVYLRSRRMGWIPIPGCGRARALADGFRALAERVRLLAQPTQYSLRPTG